MYAKSMQELYRIGKIDVNIEEPKSMDWRVEQMILPELIETIRRQFSFIPRVGELVLWCRDMDGELAFDPQTNEFKMYNPNKQVFLGHPQWMCGTVTQDPKEEVLIDDLLIETKKENAINISGFRVECLPDPNDPTKGLSKQYSYIPLRNIRPFNFWQEYLQGISEDDWHASIFHGLSVLASICVIKPFRFKGTWPNCAVFCNGAFIGAELLFVGDTVRLISEQSQPQVTDVLHIEKILVKWANLEVDEDGIVDESRAAHVSLRFIGHSYTSDKKRSYKGMTLKSQERMGEYPSGMEGYDRWYYMLRPDLLHDYSHDRIFGRCFEGEAMMLWSAEDEPTLTFGLQGTRAARLYSAENDQRIITAGKKWFWGEHRAECLDLGTFNGIEVGSRDPDRDPKAWRDTLRVIDGETSQKEAPAKMSKAAGRSTFTPINSQSSLVGSALQQADDSDESDNQDSRKAGQENEPSDSDEEMNSEEAVSKEPSLA